MRLQSFDYRYRNTGTISVILDIITFHISLSCIACILQLFATTEKHTKLIHTNKKLFCAKIFRRLHYSHPKSFYFSCCVIYGWSNLCATDWNTNFIWHGNSMQKRSTYMYVYRNGTKRSMENAFYQPSSNVKWIYLRATSKTCCTYYQSAISYCQYCHYAFCCSYAEFYFG